jgi:diguanylate cyclase (GGDEF)-like protein/PAS domain S-box-containing protein
MNEGSSDFYKALLDRMSDGVYFVDRDRRILYWNEGAVRLTGYKSGEVIGIHCHDNLLCHADARGRQLCQEGCPLSACIDDGVPRESDVFLRHKEGRRVPVNVRVQPIREAGGSIVGAVEIFSDNTAEVEARRKAEEMERLAFLDSLTHRPNRRFLEMSVRTALVEYQASEDPFGVLLVDLNDFKTINDRFGHATGDRALVEVAKTLGGALRGGDIVGRWGGDEFLAIVHNVDLVVLNELAERCIGLVREATFANAQGGSEVVSISVGAALVKPGDDIDGLIARADGLMYANKKSE